ncbi:MAG: two-component system response regulator [Deltaproteobacteria bacterium RBG_13_58_19]|nr:MAG: two-component system response regulator [Deltaproteobacteria bacterium RBG_13_58_19]
MKNYSGFTILLVEDDADDALLIQRAFRKAKIANPIQTVSDGDEAVAYLNGAERYGDRRQFPLPVLILLDLKLPRRSGFEVLAWLQSQPGLKRTPVVVLTSSKETMDVNRAYELGANSYLLKPVTFEALQEIMKAINLYWLVFSEMPMPPGE